MPIRVRAMRHTFNDSARGLFASGSAFKQLLKRTAPVRGNKRKKTGQASAAHTCTVQTANRICFRYEEHARKLDSVFTEIRFANRSGKNERGQSAALKMHRRRAGRYTRRISDLLHNPHGTDVQRYRNNLRVSHRNCGKRRSAAFRKSAVEKTRKISKRPLHAVRCFRCFAADAAAKAQRRYLQDRAENPREVRPACSRAGPWDSPKISTRKILPNVYFNHCSSESLKIIKKLRCAFVHRFKAANHNGI